MDSGIPWLPLVANYVLAAIMYTLLGRFILSFIFPPDSKNYIFRAFVRLTDPVVAVVAAITPAAVPHLVTVLFSAVWMFLLRIVLVVALTSAMQAG